MDRGAQSEENFVSVCSVRESSSASSRYKKLMSPLPDVAAESHLRISLALGTNTADLVAASLSNAVASVRSGEVVKVNVSRVLHVDRNAPPAVATSVNDITPKKMAPPQASVLYF